MFQRFESVKIRALIGARGQECHDVAQLLTPYTGAEQARRLQAALGFEQVRFFAKGVTMGDAACKAALELLRQEQLTGADIDACIFVTQTPNSNAPGNTFAYQEQLGLSPDCIFLDALQGCAGYVYGLFMASSLIAAKTARRVLLLVGETSYTSCLAHGLPSDFNAEDCGWQINNAAIFSDGASATILEFDEHATPSFYLINNYGKGYHVIYDDVALCLPLRANPLHHSPHMLHIDGTALAQFAMKEVRVNLETILERTGYTPDDLSYCIFHQANRIILSSLERVLKAQPGFVPFLAAQTGNTFCATIPLALSEHATHLERLTHKPTLLTGYGVGLCVASAITALNHTKIYAPVEL